MKRTAKSAPREPPHSCDVSEARCDTPSQDGLVIYLLCPCGKAYMVTPAAWAREQDRRAATVASEEHDGYYRTPVG